MNEHEKTGNYYLISHLTLITGLTDRTIRNYIANGILKGDKINGLWHFTPEEVDAFLHNPAVTPSIQAKHNAIVYDFLINRKKTDQEACLILDLPGHDPKDGGEFFCYSITNGDCQNIRFSYDHVSGVPRVILRGNTHEVMKLAAQYYRAAE